MIDALPPYPEYRDSGVPWAGQVPAAWQAVPLKRVFASIVNGATPDTTISRYWRGSIPWVTPADFNGRRLLAAGKRFITTAGLASCASRLVPPGSIIVTTRAPVGNVAIAHASISTNQGCKSLVPPSGHYDSWYWYYQLIHLSSYLQTISSGTTFQELGTSTLAGVPLLLPSPDEQAAIVRFLDWATRRIDRAIRAKRKLVALVTEQKQAVIHRAVTRGLDPHAPLKPSGIPWLGEIPAHWEVVRAKYLFQEVDERSATGSEELLSVSHLTGVTPRSQKLVTMFRAASYRGHKLCRPGDLVVNTMWAWMGALGVSSFIGIISPAYAVYRPRVRDSANGEFIEAQMKTRPYLANIICASTGLRASRLRLYPDQFFRLPVLCPPIAEQIAIVQHFLTATRDLDATIARTQRQIDLLREYRARLVADAVTGKLDVRAIAATLPDEALDDGEPLAPDNDDDEADDDVDATDAPDEG